MQFCYCIYIYGKWSLDSPYCLLEHVQRQRYEIFNVCFAQIAITQLSSLAGDILLSAIFLQITLMASYYNSLIWILFPIPLHFFTVSHIYLEQEFYLPPFHFYLPFSSILKVIDILGSLHDLNHASFLPFFLLVVPSRNERNQQHKRGQRAIFCGSTLCGAGISLLGKMTSKGWKVLNVRGLELGSRAPSSAMSERYVSQFPQVH